MSEESRSDHPGYCHKCGAVWVPDSSGTRCANVNCRAKSRRDSPVATDTSASRNEQPPSADLAIAENRQTTGSPNRSSRQQLGTESPTASAAQPRSLDAGAQHAAPGTVVASAPRKVRADTPNLQPVPAPRPVLTAAAPPKAARQIGDRGTKTPSRLAFGAAAVALVATFVWLGSPRHANPIAVTPQGSQTVPTSTPSPSPADLAPPSPRSGLPLSAGPVAADSPAPPSGDSERPLGTGFLLIDASPWAQVESIAGRTGTVASETQGAYTPLRVAIPAGSYSVVLYNPSLNLKKTVQVRVEPGGSASAIAVFQRTSATDFFAVARQ